jgi:phosphopantothenoylcysteine decarboxylase/phosphopantothenate--cysteine ligase
MGAAIAAALIEGGFEPVVVSGIVDVEYPAGATVYFAETTEKMLESCRSIFGSCVGVIGAAAPCDFQPKDFSLQKISKPQSGVGIFIELCQAPDILMELGKLKRADQWSIGFALETENGKENAITKLKRKNCDLIVLNSPKSINNDFSDVQIFNTNEKLIASIKDTKINIARKLIKIIKTQTEIKNP